MVRLNRLLALAASALSLVTEAHIAGRKVNIDPSSNGLQDVVTWDKHTIFVHGKRVLFYSGEFHPFRFAELKLPYAIIVDRIRLPVADLYLDVFQKIRALGYNGVSFYVDWVIRNSIGPLGCLKTNHLPTGSS